MQLHHRRSISAIIVARSDSTRLPGKVMASVCGRPLVDYVIDRALRIEGVDCVALATTLRDVDEQLAEHGRERGLTVFRGTTDDVAGRVLACADSLGAEYAIRINGDSPFLDPVLVQTGMTLLSSRSDLISNIVGRTFPYGIAVEILRTEALRRACETMGVDEREHVTQHFYANQDRFSVRCMTSDEPGLRDVRLVVDTPADLEVFGRIVEELGDSVSEADYKRVAAVYLEMQTS